MLSLLLLAIATVNAQMYKFSGNWSGNITTSDGEKLLVRIDIDNNDVTQYFYDSNKSNWRPVAPVVEQFDYNKNNFLYYWMNNSSVWSETQTYALSYVCEDQLHVVWLRQVNNTKQGNENETWSVQGTGYLTRL